MQIPKQTRSIERDKWVRPDAAPEGRNIFASDNLCMCQRGSRMCPEHKECECVDGYPRCVD